MINTSAVNLSQTFDRRVDHYNRRRSQVKKLTPFETYIALIKGYCVLSVLIAPKAFVNGGFGVSGFFVAASGILSLLAALKLVDAGL